MNDELDHIATAANRSEADTLPDLIEWMNGEYIGNPIHDAFVHGVGAAIDVIADRMDEILQRCENGRLHDYRRMEDVWETHDYYALQCGVCGAGLQKSGGYIALQDLIAQASQDWQRAGTENNPAGGSDA